MCIYVVLAIKHTKKTLEFLFKKLVKQKRREREKSTVVVVVLLPPLFLLLHRNLDDADFGQPVDWISLTPSIIPLQLLDSFRAGQHVPRFHRSGFDFQAFVDRHGISKVLSLNF